MRLSDLVEMIRDASRSAAQGSASLDVRSELFCHAFPRQDVLRWFLATLPSRPFDQQPPIGLVLAFARQLVFPGFREIRVARAPRQGSSILFPPGSRDVVVCELGTDEHVPHDPSRLHGHEIGLVGAVIEEADDLDSAELCLTADLPHAMRLVFMPSPLFALWKGSSASTERGGVEVFSGPLLDWGADGWSLSYRSNRPRS